jgi:hypothetical protein
METERLHAARMASEVLLRIILTELDREIAGHRLVRERRSTPQTKTAPLDRIDGIQV